MSETPIWRRDFPYTSAGEDAVTRREFVRYLVLASGAAAVGSVGLAGWTSLRRVNEGSPRPIVAARAIRAGGAHLFRYPTSYDPAILLRLDDGTLRAFSQQCTHLGCVVYWDRPDQQLRCPCHEGVFDAHDGHVVSGPPQRALGRIDVEVRSDGKVWALGAEPA